MSTHVAQLPRGYVCTRRETFSRTTAALDGYFLVDHIIMDYFNMRCAEGAAAIAFEMPGVMQDSEARWTAVTQGGSSCVAAARATKATCDDV